MPAFLRLIRVPNLLFIAFIQLVMQKSVIEPIMQVFGLDTGMDPFLLGLLIVGSVAIAAGGYALNDYFDVKIDLINRPGATIVGKSISRRNAMLLQQVFTAIGVLCGLVLAYSIHSFTVAFIFIVVPGLLWFYSASYKRQFLIGNLVVSFNAALAVLVVGITQLALLEKEFGRFIYETPVPKNFYSWIGGFAVFAFFCTWIRETVKDMEDENGDREMECRTMPIVWGIKKSKLFVYALILVTIAGLVTTNAFFIQFPGSLTTRYMIFGLILPLLALGYLVFYAKNPSDFHQASSFSKIIMLLGVLYSFLFYYEQAKLHGISLFGLFWVK
ncbi:MAG TPA: geranylgeranylglycerol-phosphate geranylgeranyltransferase [Paludibacter sp.]|nr:geranylgeranylglycerol-phosphate geranylgeranyltransferase [Paludibacter sp.]